MKSEFNLSNHRRAIHQFPSGEWVFGYQEELVREFIKKLKTRIAKMIPDYISETAAKRSYMLNVEPYFEIIDKLAGDKLK